MRIFLEAFGRELARQVANTIVELGVLGAAARFLERHLQRQAAREIAGHAARLAEALKTPK